MRAQPAPTGRRYAAMLCLLLPLAGCEAMTQVTPLDRLFDPERFAQRPAAPAPAPAAVSDPTPEPAKGPAPEPVPDPTIVAMEPLPDPQPVRASHRPASRPPETTPAEPEDAQTRLRQTIRQHPWVTRFWSELGVTEQARIARQLPAGGDAAGIWDSMGLADRARLAGNTPDERRWASGR